LALVPLGLISLGLARKRSKLTGLFMLALLAVAVSSVGCNGGSSKAPVTITEGTPAGSYTLVVTATSGGVSHSTNLTLVVQ